jgi:hypothetical protein
LKKVNIMIRQALQNKKDDVFLNDT